MMEGRFEHPGEIVPPTEAFINLAMIIINPKTTDDLDRDFKIRNEETLRSLLTYSSGTPLHWVIVSDERSVRSVARFLTLLVTGMMTEAVILRRDWRWKRRRELPLIKMSFVNLKDIVNYNRPFVAAMKSQAMQVTNRMTGHGLVLI